MGNRIQVHDYLQRLACQQLLDRQFLLFPGQRARNVGDLKNPAANEARAERDFDGVAEPVLHRIVERDAAFCAPRTVAYRWRGPGIPW